MSNQQADSPGLFDALSIFRRRFRYVVLGTLLGLAIAAVYFVMLKPKFESVTSFLVDLPENLPGRSGDPTGEGSILSDDTLADHVFIVDSAEVIQQALKEANLMELESIQNSLEEDQTEVEYVAENLRVTRGGEGQLRNARVITVRMRHGDADDTAAILKAIIASYKDFIGEQSGETGDQAIDTLREELNKAKQNLDKMKVAYDKFRDANPMLLGNQVDRINPYQDEVTKWNDSLAEIRALKIETRSRIDTVRKLLSKKVGYDRVELLQKITGQAGRPEIVETARVEVNELWQMMLRERDLLEQYGPGHPLVRRSRAGIHKMKELLATNRREMERDFALLVVSDLQELNRREVEETKYRDSAMQKAAELDAAVRKDLRYLEDLKHEQNLYNIARTRLDEAIIAKSHGAILTKTLAPVKVGEPITPSPVLILAMGTLVGLFMGLGLAVVADNLDAGAVHEAEVKVTRQPRTMHDSKLQHVRPNVGAAV